MENNAFSRLLLDLYRAAANTPVKEFRHAALKEIQRHLPFDGVAWMTIDPAGHCPPPYVWVLSGAPEEMIRLLPAHSEHDEFLRLLTATPGEPQVLRFDDMTEGGFVRVITTYAGMRHVMTTAQWNEALGTLGILTLGRRDAGQPFLEEEKTLKRLLMPHLEAMVVRNFESQILATMVGHVAASVGLAMVAEDAMVLVADPNFLQLVQHEWPAWSGPRLPDSLVKAVLAGKPLLTRGMISFHLMHRQGHLLLIASRQSAIGMLTEKEHTIAAEFAHGKSYKEVARAYGISPETVRSRLRMVYEKLGICDKGELSRHFEQNKLLENLQDLL